MQTATGLIAKNLKNRELLPIKKGINTICCFSGERITEGVLKKDVLSSNFTDTQYLRYDSKYISVETAQCMQPISSDGRASLRNYSFFATENELKLLQRSDIWDILVNEKATPFILCVTYNGKKHVSYTAQPQYRNDIFSVYTDTGEVIVGVEALNELIPILKSWYSVVKGKEKAATPPTYFTKDEILTGEIGNNKIQSYGVEKYFQENQILEKYRNLPILKLLVFILQKSIL